MSDSLPVVAIVGRPNVGKSTLFNQLTRTRDALVGDRPGVTRDRIYGRTDDFIVIDTGGLAADPDELETRTADQVGRALDESDTVIFVTDARAGLNAHDAEIADKLRRRGLPIVPVVNKIDGLEPGMALAEAGELAIGEPVAISAEHRRGLNQLHERIVAALPPAAATAQGQEPDDHAIRLAFIGRPNTGKSTLLNRLAGEERSLAIDMPGTTRDPVSADIERDGWKFRIVDTAGIRRRAKVTDRIEKYSVIKAIQSIEKAQIIVLLADAQEAITDQDAALLGHVLEAGRGLVVAVNKWDGLEAYQREQILDQVKRKLNFAGFARVVTISAKHGTGLGELFRAVRQCWQSANRELSTSALSGELERAVRDHPPPSSQRFVPKLRYAHTGGHFPTRIIIHGNRTKHVPESYKRFLMNRFRAAFDLTGIPIHLIFKESENPYAGRKNKLTARQMEKRRRLKKHVRQR